MFGRLQKAERQERDQNDGKGRTWIRGDRNEKGLEWGTVDVGGENQSRRVSSRMRKVCV